MAGIAGITLRPRYSITIEPRNVLERAKPTSALGGGAEAHGGAGSERILPCASARIVIPSLRDTIQEFADD
jgi:hypothetical protein